jgi:hypothetical protein
LEESPIKIAAKASGKPTSIDKESPEGIDDGIASEVAESVDPGISCGQVDQKEAILVPPRPHSIAKAYVSSDSVASAGGPRDWPAASSTIDVDRIANGGRGFTIGCYMKAIAKEWKGAVIQLPAPK